MPRPKADKKTEYIVLKIPSELAEEINAVVASDGVLSGYYFPRITNFCGHWIHHSGWYPEYVLRLFRKNSAHFTNDMIHESIECHGKTTRLTGRFLHYSYPDMKSFGVKLQSGKELWSGCSGVGLERWTAVFLAQKGLDPENWPDAFKKFVGELPEEVFKFV